jgi:hypothetical protein
MIGLSVSFCIKDIAMGKVSIDDVERIEAGTHAETDADWEEVIKAYRELYWQEFPDAAEAILRDLFAQGKIEQPRLHGAPIRNIGGGHWAVKP